MASTNRSFGDLPLWRRVIAVVLIPLVLPALLLVMLLLLLAMAWNSFAYSIHWVRWKLFGIPVPPISLPPAGPAR